MKEETKELIDWIKKQINLAKDCCIKPAWGKNHEQYNNACKKAFEFLDSLPEIESKLCHGGYIQDKNGTPCCHGDNVKFIFDDCIDDRRFEMFGQLAWHFKKGQFFILTNSKDYELDRLKWFEKVE